MEYSIPKVIHYCWFGGKPIPRLARKCIRSWKKFLPDYEIKRWDESNFDVDCIPYVREAYRAGKYAFVSDYARFKILYEEGGLYFDTDVQVIKPLDDIIARGSFMGCQNKYHNIVVPEKLGINPGLGLGVYPGHHFYKEMLDLYRKLVFINKDGLMNLKTVVYYTTEMLVKKGLKISSEIQSIEGIWVYPWDYFCPMEPTFMLELTKNSRTIHLFSASWCSPMVKFRKKIKRILGYRIIGIIQPIVLIFRKKFSR